MKPRRLFSAARLSFPFAAALVALFSAQSMHAAAYDWTGANNGTWNTNTNWSGAVVPLTGDTLTILGPLNVAGALNINFDANNSASTIAVTNTAATTLTNTTSGSNKTLTLSGSGTALTTGSGAVTIGSATANQAVNVALGASQTWNVGAGGLTVNNVISGSGFGLTKSGTGTLTLAGANTYTGGTTINASSGTLQATVTTTTNALGSGAVSVGTGSTLLLNNTSTSGTTTISNTFTGAGLLRLQFAANTTARNTGMANVTGFTGTIRLSNLGATGDKWAAGSVGTVAGSLLVDSGSTIFVQTAPVSFTGGITLNGAGNSENRGAIRLSGTTLGGNIALASSSTINIDNAAGVITGNITSGAAGTQTLTLGAAGSTGGLLSGIIGGGTGTLALTTATGGTYTLSNVNTYTGTTTVAGSTILRATTSASALGAGALSLGGGTLQLAHTAALNFGRNTTVTANSTITADRTTSSATSLTHTLGTLTIAGQTLSIARGTNITGAGVGGITFGNATLTGAATFTTNANTLLTLSGTTGLGTNTLTKSGAGSMTLTGVVSGTKAAGSNAISITGGLLTASNAGNTFSGNIAVSGAGSVFAMAGGTFTTAAPYGRAGNLYKQLLLTNGGAYRLTSGSFNNNAPDATNTAEGIIFNIGSGGGTLDLASGTTLTIDDGSGSGTGVAASQLQGSGTLTKTGNGTLSLGNSTASNAVFTGQILINTGVLRLGAVSAAGVALGSTGANTVIASGAGFDIANSASTAAEPLTISGTGVGGTGNVIFTSHATGGSFAGPITLGANSTIGSTAAGLVTLTGGVTGSANLTIRNTAAGGTTLSTGSVNHVGTLTNSGTGAGSTLISAPIGSSVTDIVQNSATSGMTLSNASIAYTGATTVSAGSLNITGGSTVAPTMTALTVAGGASLGLVNNAGQQFDLGSGAINLGGAGTTTLGLELGAPGTHDNFTTTGAATTSGNVALNLYGISGLTAGTYPLLAASGGLDTSSYSLTSVPGGFTYSLSTAPNLIQLTTTAVTGGADLHWRGGVNNSWSALSGATTNWDLTSGGTSNAGYNPAASNRVIFSNSNATGPAIITTLDNNVSILDLEFTSAPSGVTSVTIAPGTFSTNSLTIAPSASSDGIGIAANAGAVTISAPVVLGAEQTWSVDSTASSLTVSGAISGLAANGLTFTTTAGTAPIILSAAGTSTYSGPSTVSAATIVQGGATNGFSPNTAWTVDGTLNTGAFNQATGSLAGGSGIVQNSSVTNATLTIGSDNLASATFAGTIQNGSTGTLGLTKAGTGTQILSGTNTYTGTTTVSNGTLRIANASAYSATSGLVVNGTGTFDISGNSITAASLGAGAATGTITNSSTSTGASTATAPGTPSGAGIYVDSLTGTAALGANITNLVTDGATRKTQIVLNNANGNISNLSNTANSFSGGLVLAHNAGGTRLSVGTITGTPWGTGPIIIGQTATDKAGIYFNTAGQTMANDIVFNTALGTDRVGIRTDGAGQILSGKITANLAPATFTANTATAGAFTLTGQVTGANGLVLDITSLSASATAFNVTLNNGTVNPNDYQGDTVINLNAATGKSATLNLGAANQIPNGTGTGNVIINSNGTGNGILNLAGFSDTINGLSGNGTVTTGGGSLTLGDNNATASFSGVITGGTVNKMGGGTQTFSGANTYTAMTVTGGLVDFASSPATSGPLGNTTSIDLSGGGLTYTASGTNALNRSVAIGAGNGTLDVSSAAGTLTVGTVTSSGGNLVKTGPGSVVISGTTNLSAAGVVVNGGKLQAGFGTGGVGAITVDSSGSLSFQNSTIEALTLATSGTVLTLNNGARLGFELDGATNDSITVPTGGALALTGGYTFDFFGLNAGVTANTYTLLTAPTGSALNSYTYALGDAPLGFNYTFITTDTMVQLQTVAYSPIYWSGLTDSSWATAANFTDQPGTTPAGHTPLATETVIFNAANAAGPTLTTNLDGSVTIDSLQFNGANSVTSVTIAEGTGGTLTLKPASASGGIAILTGGGNATISAPLTLDNTLSASQAWKVTDAGSTLDISGNVNFGATIVNKSGAGAVTLSGANSGTGAFNLNAGTLNLNSAAALGTGALNIAAGTTFNNTSGGAVTLSANGAVNLNGDFTFTGTQSLNLGTGAVTLSGNPIANVAANTLTLGGAVGGTSNLTKAGAGTLVLDANNTYTGVTTISGGVLRITKDSGLGTTGSGTSVADGSALELDGTGGAISVGAEALTINGGGITNLGALRNIAGDNTYGGSIAMGIQSRINSDSGTLTLNNASAVSATNLTLVVGGAGNTTISGAVTLGTGGVSKDGTGILTLSGTNAYTGNTTVNGGTLNITGSISGLAATTNLAYGGTAGNTIVNISGSGSISNYKNFQGANVAGSIAVMNQTGGSTSTLGTNGNDTQWVAQNGGYGYLNITGGTFNTGRFDAVGATGGGTAVVYVGGGGTFNNNSGDWLILPRNTGVGQLTVGPGGSLVRTAAVTANLGITMDASNAHGALNIAGGTVDTGVRPINFGFGSAAFTNTRGFVNLAGGTLSVGAAIAQSNTNAGGQYFEHFNFAGGTLKSNAAITWLPAASAAGHTITATIYGEVTNNNNANAAFNTQIGTTSNFTGGLTVDTNNFATTIAQALRGADGVGVTQADIGDVSALSGNSGYIGAPSVVFSAPASPTGVPASGYAVIDTVTGKVNGIVITNPGTYAASETPTITLTGGGGTIAAFNTAALSTANTSGGLTKTGLGTLTLSGANNYSGKTIVSGGGLSFNTIANVGGGNSALGAPTTIANGTIDLDGTLIYTGAAAATDRVINLTSAATGSTINNSGSGLLTLNGDITGNATNMLFRGAGSITMNGLIPASHAGSVSHTEAGTLTLTNSSNAWTGSLVVSAGTVSVNNIADKNSSSAIGAGTLITLGQSGFNNTGTFRFTGASGGSSDRDIVIQSNLGNTNGGIIENTVAGQLLTLSGGITVGGTGLAPSLGLTGAGNGLLSGDISGSPALAITKSGTGTWTLTGSNTYTGTTTINQGTLRVTGSGVLGGAAGSTTDANNIVFGQNLNSGALEFETVANLGSADQIRFRNTGGTAGQGGALVYVGTTDVTLGKTIQCDTSIGIRIESNSVGGSLTLNGPFSQTNRTIYLGGTGTGNNTLATDFAGTGALIKRDAGTWILSGAKTYSGSTIIERGTLGFATDQTLTGGLQFGSANTVTTAGMLDLTNANATFAGALTVNSNSATNEIKIGAAQTLTINNNVQIGATPPVGNAVTRLNMTGGGVFNVTTAAAGTFNVGGTTLVHESTLDLTALSATTINTSATGTIRLNANSATNVNGTKSSLLLPAPVVADTVATATLTAGTIAVGNSSTFNSVDGQINTLQLGTGLTTLNANTIGVGTGSRDIGQIIFGGAGGDVSIRAADGSSRATTFAVGTGGAGTGTTHPNVNNLVDFSGHDANILVTSLNVGNQARVGNLISEFRFGAGDASLASVLDATNVNIGFRTGTATATSILTNRVILSGGTVTFGNVGATGTGVDIGNSAYTGAGAASTIGELNISGGNVTIHNGTGGFAIRLGTNVAAGGGTVTASLNLTGGTTTLSGNIIKNPTLNLRTTSSLTLNGAGAILDMGGNDITSLNSITYTDGTLRNLGTVNTGMTLAGTGSRVFDQGTGINGEIQGVVSGSGIGLDKQGAGKLTLSGANTYTGATTVSAGTLLVNGSTDSASAVTVAATATLGGTGTINGTVNVTGVLSPGASIETLATGALSLNTGSTLAHELDSSALTSVGSDLLKVTGNLSIAGTVGLTLADIAGTPIAFNVNDTFSLVNYTGTWNGGKFTFASNELDDEEVFTFGLNDWKISYNDTAGGSNYATEHVTGSFVNLTVVPEPSSVALLGVLGSMLLLRRRR